MPVEVGDLRMLQSYVRQLLKRARHHAHDVDQIVFPLAGAIIWRKSPAALEVRQAPSGGMGSALWVVINRKRYAFSYNHSDKCIDMKQDSLQGSVLHKFDNKTPLPKLIKAFEDL